MTPKPCSMSPLLATAHSSVTSVTSTLQQKNDEHGAKIIPTICLLQQKTQHQNHTQQDQHSVQHATTLPSNSSNALVHSNVNSNSNISNNSSSMDGSFHSLFQAHRANLPVSDFPISPRFCSSSPLSKPIRSLSQSDSAASAHFPSPLSLSRPYANLASPAASPNSNFSVSASGYSHSTSATSACVSRSIFSPFQSVCKMNSNWNSACSSDSYFSSVANQIQTQMQNAGAEPSFSHASPLPSPLHSTLPHEGGESSAFPSFYQTQTSGESISAQRTARVLAMSPLDNQFISAALTSSSALSCGSSISELYPSTSSIVAPAAVYAFSASASALSFPNLQPSPLSSPALFSSLSSIRGRSSSPQLDLSEFNDVSDDDKDSPLETPSLQRQNSYDSIHSVSMSSVSSSSSPMHVSHSCASFSPTSPPISGSSHANEHCLPSPDELLARIAVPQCQSAPQLAMYMQMQLCSDSAIDSGKRGRKRSACEARLALDTSEEEDEELSTISSLSTSPNEPEHSLQCLRNEDDEKQLGSVTMSQSLSSSSASSSVSSRRGRGSGAVSISRSSATSSCSSVISSFGVSDKDRKNLKRSRKRRTSKKEQRLCSILAMYPSHGGASARVLYPDKNFYFHPPAGIAKSAPSDFGSSQWIHSADNAAASAPAGCQVVLKLNEVDESKRCELVVEVDLGPEAPPDKRSLLMFSGVTLFHDSKSLCTTSSSMRKRAKLDDAAFFEISSHSLFLRALSADLTMEDSPMVHAFNGSVCDEIAPLIHFWTPGYPLRYRDRVNAKKAEAYASLLALSRAELRIEIIPPNGYPNATIRCAALHLRGDATEKGYAKSKDVLMPAQPVLAVPNKI